MVAPQNIEQLSEENFSGNHIAANTAQQIAEDLIQLSSPQIEKMVEENYQYIKEKLSIQNNTFLLSNVTRQEPDERSKIKSIIELEEKNKQQLQEQIRRLEEEKMQEQNIRQEKENQIAQQNTKIQSLTQELEAKNQELEHIYQSRWWKIRKLF